ncbi:MAG TPA: ankyrin repeat domain-containing protein [Verrucomicrobiae bacterium]|nr:ankyrin repeat domain-containing protein [Verrucomicrobiae bacterium]
MDTKVLPLSPSLEQYKKQAKDLLKSVRAGNPDALALTLRRLKNDHPRLGRLADLDLPGGKFALADAQFVIAREHGFESWPKFLNHIKALAGPTSSVSSFESAVDAVVTGDLVKLEQMLRESPELVRERSTFLHHATLLNYVGANGVENYRQKTPKNAVQVAEVLLRAGADIQAVADIYGGSDTLGLVATSIFPFLAGVQNALIDTLLEHGANLNSERLINACLANGRGPAAEHLAQRGAPLNLEGAAGVGRLDLVKASFTEIGRLRTDAEQEQMERGFCWACQYGRTSVVEFLLGQGLKVDASPQGITGLHWAAHTARVDIVKLLLKNKAPVEVRDGRHQGTPLGWALHAWSDSFPESSDYYKVVALLIAAGARLNSALPADTRNRDRLVAKLRADARMATALKGETTEFDVTPPP